MMQAYLRFFFLFLFLSSKLKQKKQNVLQNVHKDKINFEFCIIYLIDK